ncbi:MAG: hypothetical protein DHS20C15_34230 [Planctomycetota bacterium]|nr:MAG: hypothetical protein DHS20C15_34230 [Planctomycetota bacterium]
MKIAPDRADLDRAALAGLFRPRIAVLVLMTTVTGFALERPASWTALPWALLGTLLSAAAGCALNHYLERDTDALMERTRPRPLVTGALLPREVLVGGVLLALLGLAILAVGATPFAALVQGVALLVYLAIYTPLKRRTSANTWVGAVPGALPLITGSAAAGGPTALSWAAFLLIFLWQLPHFFAIASMYREQYAEGGLRMLSGEDPDDRLLRWQMPMQVMSVMLVSLIPVAQGAGRELYLATAVLVGLVFLLAAFGFRRQPDRRGARRVVLASVVYLPLVLLALVLDVACVQPSASAHSSEEHAHAAGVTESDVVSALSTAAPADATAAPAHDAPCADCASAGMQCEACAAKPVDPSASEPACAHCAAEGESDVAADSDEAFLPWSDRPTEEQERWFVPAVGESGLPVFGQLPEFELMTEARAPFNRDSFAGRVWIVGFIYARCGGVCADMTRAYQLLHEEELPAHFLSVTIDPQNDTPEMLTAYRKEWKGSADWWTLLTGSRDVIQNMADEGFHLPVNTLYTEVEGMPKMFHSQRLALIDSEARIRGYYAPHDEQDRQRLHRDAIKLARLLDD